jgi:hypothetical protein
VRGRRAAKRNGLKESCVLFFEMHIAGLLPILYYTHIGFKYQTVLQQNKEKQLFRQDALSTGAYWLELKAVIGKPPYIKLHLTFMVVC